jgi:glycosidase
MALLAFPFAACADELSVSPPNWWAGMASPHVELMVYGNDIVDDKVSVVNGNAAVTESVALDSKNYLFVTLDTSKSKAGDIELVFTDPDGSKREMTYSLMNRKQNSAAREGFGPKDAIYLIAPDRFANADKNNDNIDGYVDTVNRSEKGGRHGGDIKGIIDNLDYISELGFTQIWTMPLLENAMDNYSYHGYSTTDYYNIDPRFGTNEDYITLSNKANDAGVGLIMDMVLNHIGSNHLWMEDMPSKDWINNDGKFVGTTHKRESLHDPHAIDSDIKGFSDGWFVPTMPDLNQRNPHLANYLIQNAIWWVEYANLSGIRVDTYSYPDKAFLSAWTQRVMQEYPNLNIVGEEWSVNPAITAYWQRGSHKHDDYVSALPSVMDFPLQTAVVKALDSEESWNSGFITIYETLATDFLYSEPNNLVIFPDNHDMSRIFTQVGHDIDKWNMAMTLFLTTRGIPQVFYGTEILMQNEGTTDHGIIRTDFPGGWQEDTDKNAFTGEGLTDNERWAQKRTKQLLSLRKTHPHLFEGDMKHYAPKDGVYTYFRLSSETQDGALMVVLNKQETSIDLSEYTEVIGGFSTLTRLRDGAEFTLTDTVALPAMSATVFVVQ